MNKKILFWAALMLPLVAFCQPSPNYIPFFVTSVHDGDTFTALSQDSVLYKVRPIGFDAPEIRSNIILETQPYGRESGDILRASIKGKWVLLDTTAIKGQSRDIYGRLLAEVYFSDSSSLALAMVKGGLAWAVQVPNRKFPKTNTILKDAQREARKKVLGLWFGYLDEKGRKRYPVAPWTHRKRYGIQ